MYGVTAGSINYLERVNSISQSREEYIKSLGVAPGPPHMQGIYATPDETGLSYPDGGTPATTYTPPGWPRKVVPLEDKDPNGPPGAPIQFYEPMSNEEVEPGFAFEGSGHVEETGRYFYHSDHLGSTAYVTDFRGRVSQYVAYMPYGEALYEQHSNTRDMPYKFNGKEKDEETGLYYYGARYYDDEGIWLGVDPLWYRHPDIGAYVYCAANPVRLVDPDGQDWVEREVDGVKETYYDRKVKSQADVDKKYGKGSGVSHLVDGTKVGNGQYSVYNDHENNRDGRVVNNEGNTMSSSDIIYGNNFTIFGTTDESVNAETLHQNWMGSYTGPNNPKDYRGEDSYQYLPRNASEYASRQHDLDYGAALAEGPRDALLNTRVIGADAQLVLSSYKTAMDPRVPLKDRGRAALTGLAFHWITGFKTVKYVVTGGK